MPHSHELLPETDDRDAPWQIVPGYDEVECQFQGLIDGSYSREDVADWASEWFHRMDVNHYERSAVNCHIFEAIKRLIGADILTEDRPYLYGREDFEGWYAEFKALDPA